MTHSPRQYCFDQIGIVHSRFTEQEGTPIQGKMAPEETAEVEIFDEFVEGLKDLDGFSHIYLIYRFDRIEKTANLVKPYLDTEVRGVFSTRSPRRPNPIGLTVVRLASVNGNRIKVSGVDLLDKTPIIDIKPYIPDFDQHEPEKIGWYGEKKNRSSLVLADNRFEDDPRSE